MRVLVCGGREYANAKRVDEVLNTLHPTKIIHGGARGADTLAGRWAGERGISVDVYPANWKEHGNGAGPRRNHKMLRESEPDIVVAFPGGRGTAHMVGIAKKAGVVILTVEQEEEGSDE